MVCSALLFPSLVLAEDSPAQSAESTSAFTLMPMFLPNGTSYSTEEILKAMVKDQGYEAHCAAMQWTIDKKLLGDINKFFSGDVPPEESFYHGLNPTIFDGVDPYLVDMSKARIPMYRGMEDKNSTQKNSSLEGMFGANYQTAQNSYMLNAAGVGKRVLSSYQQCLAKTQNILASKLICDEVTDDCTINKKYNFKIAVDQDGGSKIVTDGEAANITSDQHIVDVDFKITDLLDWVKEIRPELEGEKLYQQVCFDLTGGDSNTQTIDYKPPTVSPDKIAKTREAIGRIPIDLDTLYRIAFLVLVPTQDPGKDDDGDKFYFLQEDPQIDAQVHAPIFIAFKIPDFGTNKSRIAGNIDTLELTRMVIQPKEQNDKDLKDQADRRELLYELAQTQPDPVIHCPYPKCGKPLEKSLISIINGASLKCKNDTLRVIENTTSETGEQIDMSSFAINERQATASGIELVFNQEDLNWEAAGDLFTPASKEMKQYSYRSSPNKQLVDQLKDKHITPFEWELVVDEDRPPLDPPMIVNAYLVLPVGENIKDTNKALSIFWSEEDFFNLVRTNIIEDMTNDDGTSKMGAIPKYYTIKGADLGIGASQEIHPIDECLPEEIFKNGVWTTIMKCSHYAFGFGFSDITSRMESSSKGNLLLPDFGLGFMVRKIQQKLRNTYNQTYDYILSCQRVEDMFLGRCKGDPKGAANQSFCNGEAFKNIKGLPPASQIPEFAKNMFNSDIAPRITPELIEAYEYAEQETGIPCEVVAGIHWTEAGLDPNGSVFSGAPLSTSLKEDAKAAMEHLIKDDWPGNFDKNNIQYEDLVEAIGNYNGPGNMNCSSDMDNNPRATRWREGGKCEAQFPAEDHPHPVAWIDDRHSDMDLIYCMDFAEFSCQTEGTDYELEQIAQHIRDFMAQSNSPDAWSEEKIQAHLQQVKEHCFASSSLCQNLSDGSKYVKYERPGSVTTAILLNESGSGMAAP